MITAKELFDKMLEENEECTSTEMMIEFAKLHVEACKKEASEKATVKKDVAIFTEGYSEFYVVNKDSILNSYPLDNIK